MGVISMEVSEVYAGNLANRVVSGAMLRDCLYTANKLAKHWRDVRDMYRYGVVRDPGGQ